MKTELTWTPPKKNELIVGGYHIERKSWWPGRPSKMERLTGGPVTGTSFIDEKAVPDMVNEYRCVATHIVNPEIISIPSFPAAVYGFNYLRYDEMLEKLKILESGNSDVCRLVDAGPASGGERRIWCVVLGEDLSDNPDKPAVFLLANAHAAENQCSDVCVGLVEEALRLYASGDEAFKKIFKHVQIRIIPMYNAYGRSCVENGFPGRARKSSPVIEEPPDLDPLRVFDCWSADYSPGLDPNRTYDVAWEFAEAQRTKDIQGESPFSLPETKAVAKMALAARPQITIDYHAPCGIPFYPASWPDGSTPVDEELTAEVAEAFSELTSVEFPADQPGKSSFAYDIPVGWGSAWFYKNFYGASICAEGFWEQMPIDSRLLAIGPKRSLEELIPKNLENLRWMCERVLGAGVTVRVSDPSGEPIEALVEVIGQMDPHCLPQKTDAEHGVYRRILSPGVYDFRITAEGRKEVLLKNKSVSPRRNKEIRVVMPRRGEVAE